MRFSALTEHLHLSKAALAETIGVSRSLITLILSNKSKPGFEVIEATLKSFPQVNSDWLIKGEGEMFRSTTPPKQAVAAGGEYLLDKLAVLEASFQRLASVYEEELAQKNRQIDGLQRTVDALVGKSEPAPGPASAIPIIPLNSRKKEAAQTA